MNHQPLTQIAHSKIARQLHSGDWVIDATAGNGHDTVFLAENVGTAGHVYAFDIQTQAIKATASRLSAVHLQERVTLCHNSHGAIQAHTPSIWHGAVAVIMFNLGYLPHSDKSMITRPDATIPALEQSLCLLKPGGILSIIAYRSHGGGLDESEAVIDWIQSKRQFFSHELYDSKGPVLHLCHKNSI